MAKKQQKRTNWKTEYKKLLGKVITDLYDIKAAYDYSLTKKEIELTIDNRIIKYQKLNNKL